MVVAEFAMMLRCLCCCRVFGLPLRFDLGAPPPRLVVVALRLEIVDVLHAADRRLEFGPLRVLAVAFGSAAIDTGERRAEPNLFAVDQITRSVPHRQCTREAKNMRQRT